jgi:DHA2 family multidrug resistance protein
MICVAVFTVATFLCGLAPNLGMLIVFRILQGLGGGGMAPSEQAILADSFPPEKRAQAFALYGVAVIVAPTVGPTLGGWITDNFSWHWIFFINVPIGIVSLVLVQWLLVEPPLLQQERRDRLARGIKVDWVGFTLVALALGALEIVLDKGQRDDWLQSDFIVIFAIVSAVSFVLLVPWELSRPDPIVDLRLLLRRQFALAFLVMMAVGAVLFSSTQLLPQLLQTSFQYTALLSGLALMPGGLAMLVMMPISGIVSSRVQPKYLMALAMAGIALSMWASTALSQEASFSFFAWIRVWQMIGLPFLFIPINTVAYSGLPGNKTNEASALINVARNLGGSIGVSLTNTELAQRSQFHQARLVEHVTPSSPAYQQAARHITDVFAGQGDPHMLAQQHATGWIAMMVQNQSTLLAYVDVFFVCAVFAALMIPLALLLRRVDLKVRAGPAH